MSAREPSTYTLRERGRGCTAASSTWADAARNFGWAFMATPLEAALRGTAGGGEWWRCSRSLRRHDPDQVRRRCLTGSGRTPALTASIPPRAPPSPCARSALRSNAQERFGEGRERRGLVEKRPAPGGHAAAQRPVEMGVGRDRHGGVDQRLGRGGDELRQLE